LKRFTVPTFTLKALVVLTLTVLTGCSSQSTVVSKLGAVVSCNSIALGASSNGLEFPCLDGKSSIHFSQMRGPLIVNVWGSWCAPCKDEIPMIRSFYSKNSSIVHLVGVDVEEAKKSDGSDFVVTNGMTWPILVDPDARSRGFFGMGVPVTWFIDKNGSVVHKKIGVLNSEQELRDLAAKYLHLTLN
jgi:cytochrome c biogenesis protein CcmG/thiol:disulfide interchange protein DsbE